MRAALAHYEDLGFEVMEYMEWAWAQFEASEIHFFVKQGHDPTRTAAAADIRVEDCDAQAAR
jgi:hypothetical protein